MNRPAKTVITVTLTLGGAAVALASTLAVGSDTPAIALWLGLLIGGAIMEIATLEGKDDEELEHPFSLAASFHLAGAILLPPGWAALVAGASTMLGETARRRTPVRVGFNGAVATVATLAAASVFQGMAPDGAFENFEWSVYPPILTMWFTYVVVSIVAVVSISAAMTQRRWNPMAVVRGPELVSYVMEGCLAVVLAILINEAPRVLLFGVLLLVAVFLAMKRHRALRHETRETLKALAAAVDARDPYTAQHSERVGDLASRLAEAVELPEQTIIDTRWAGRLHDLGKVVVDNSILHKPGALDDDEWELMRSHPIVSADLLSSLSLTRSLLPAIRQHHERQDGKGYFNVPGEEISLGASMLTLADSFDAMTTDRPYRKAMPVEDALAIIESGLGTHFHAELGRAFIAMIREEPIPKVDLDWKPPRPPAPPAAESEALHRDEVADPDRLVPADGTTTTPPLVP